MRIFFAGASGVIGRCLVPILVRQGHHVSAMTRSPQKINSLEAIGAEPVLCDVLDAERLRSTVAAARPDVVIQHLTDLPPDLSAWNLKKAYARNDRVRGPGALNLLKAAEAAGGSRYIAQHVCFNYSPVGPPVVDEEAPVWTDAPEPFGRSIRMHQEVERRIIENPGLDGLVLRFGIWYGRGTTFASDGYTARQVRNRRYPAVGDGGGIHSFVHVEDVAEATIAAIHRGSPGVYNICDDDPAPMREWLPFYAQLLGAKPPRRIPRWLAKLIVGKFAVIQATEVRGASNDKAKGELDWKPKYASWRLGFRTALG